MSTVLLICLVDDSEDYRLMVRNVFAKFLPDWKLCLYESGVRLLDGLAAMDKQPDLILLDQHMPELNGHQTLRALKDRASFRTIPVVMISADASASERNLAYELGASAFAVKPLHWEELKDFLVMVSQFAHKLRF